jgi:hypothetical protein
MQHELATPAEQIIILNQALTEAAIPFAFGGAIARNYYADVRTTTDIDVGVFLPPEQHQRVLSVLSALFAIDAPDEIARRIERDGQVRIPWGRTPVDLFFSYDAFHEVSAARVRHVDFADARLPILSPEDLILHKLTFARSKDWRDIADILYAQRGSLDLPYIQRWLAYFFPPDQTKAETDETRVDSRVKLFGDLLDTVQRSSGDAEHR